MLVICYPWIKSRLLRPLDINCSKDFSEKTSHDSQASSTLTINGVGLIAYKTINDGERSGSAMHFAFSYHPDEITKNIQRQCSWCMFCFAREIDRVIFRKVIRNFVALMILSYNKLPIFSMFERIVKGFRLDSNIHMQFTIVQIGYNADYQYIIKFEFIF